MWLHVRDRGAAASDEDLNITKLSKMQIRPQFYWAGCQ